MFTKFSSFVYFSLKKNHLTQESSPSNSFLPKDLVSFRFLFLFFLVEFLSQKVKVECIFCCCCHCSCCFGTKKLSIVNISSAKIYSKNWLKGSYRHLNKSVSVENCQKGFLKNFGEFRTYLQRHTHTHMRPRALHILRQFTNKMVYRQRTMTMMA